MNFPLIKESKFALKTTVLFKVLNSVCICPMFSATLPIFYGAMHFHRPNPAKLSNGRGWGTCVNDSLIHYFNSEEDRMYVQPVPFKNLMIDAFLMLYYAIFTQLKRV